MDDGIIGSRAQIYDSGTEDTEKTVQGAGQNDPFSFVTVDKLVSGGTKIYWGIEPSFGEPTPWNFTVQWGTAGTGDWTNITTVSDAFTATDPQQREYSALFDGFYRVQLTTDAGNTYSSLPSNYPSEWTTRDLRIVDELRRKELLLYRKREGVKCWILYRKHWGEECSCVDSTTGEVTDPSCTDCYGTGFVGGYYAPHQTYCFIQEAGTAVRTGRGTTAYNSAQARIVPIPPVCKYDILILEDSDQRLEVTKSKPEAVYKNRVLAQMLELEALDPSHVVYEMTWSGSSDPSKGETAQW